MRRLRITLASLIAMTPALAGLARAAEPGDAERGAKIYEQRCGACHSLDANRVGPRHRGVYGRKAGSIPDFPYSPAVKASQIIWTRETLDAWLTDPQKLIPGQRMNYRLSDPQLRADVIIYLKKESGKIALRPLP